MAEITTRLIVTTVMFLAACGVRPDEKSGGDHERHKATPVKVGEAVADSVSYKDGDRTDWKVVELPDAGFLTVLVNLDNPKNDILVALFDRYGKPVAKMVHHKSDESPLVQLITQAAPGRYFILVQAASEGAKTGYALKVSLQ